MHADSAPTPRRAAAGALFTITNTTSKQILIHGGRLAAGHILDDLWQGSLGAGNITYQQLWPPQQDALQKKRKKPRPFAPKARKGHAAVAIEDPDACLVSILSLLTRQQLHVALPQKVYLQGQVPRVARAMAWT